jgi:UDP-glucuronate 4-epimerase
LEAKNWYLNLWESTDYFLNIGRFFKIAMILVTGGAGFIGSHLCERLLKLGNAVVAVDNLDPYYDVAQKQSNLKVLEGHENFRFIEQDIRDFEKLKAIFTTHRPDKLVHLAAKCGVRASLDNPKEYEEVNIGGTLNLLRLSAEFKLSQFVFGSSSSVYGSRTKVPFCEAEPVDFPISPYAASKRSAELFCYVYHHLFGLNVVALRFFTVYGPRGRPDMAPYKFMDWVMKGQSITRFGDGSSSRDYTYVQDIVSGIVAALDSKLGFEIINLGNNVPVKLNEFISAIEEVTGRKANIVEKPMQPGDVLVTAADITKARRLLNYSPTTKLQEGLRAMYEWQR